MRQATEEGFILDVLQNYTSYKLAFAWPKTDKPFQTRKSSAALH